jgi:AcrR family transcriptional regulator
MVAAVAEHGFANTTVRELVTLAGVSKSTFYNHFESKQECFLATFDTIVDQLIEAVTAAFAAPEELRDKMVAALTVFMRLAVDHPQAAALVAVDSLTLGPPGVAHREAASERFQQMMDLSLVDAAGATEMPKRTTQALVAGVRAIAYWRLRAGTQAELPGLVEPLVDWALSYLQPPGELTERAATAAAEPAPPPPPPEHEELPGWDEPPDSRRSRRALTQRARIVRATARVVTEKGYDGLTIPGISGAAGVSNQTFYEHFESKRDAFIAAFEELLGRLVAVTAAAVAGGGDRVEALGIGIRAMLEWIAANEAFARIAFFELPVAGPVALDRGDEALGAFTEFIAPGAAPGAFGRDLPAVVREAIGGGVWGGIQFELHHGRRPELPSLAPEMVRLALAPLERG